MIGGGGVDTTGRVSLAGVNVAPDVGQNRFRTRRLALFLAMVQETIESQGSCRILDVGGTHAYWRAFGAELPKAASITLLNLTKSASQDNGDIQQEVGDACNMSQFPANSFDIVHSNSVIEHVGLWDRMAAMASEVRRVAPSYFVQTPNYWFPVEAHSRTPFFHLLPEPWRASMLLGRRRGFWPKASDVGEATRIAQSAILLDHRQLAHLFPDGRIWRERFLGMTKSLVAIKRPT